MVIYFICLLILREEARAGLFISLVQFGGYSLIAGRWPPLCCYRRSPPCRARPPEISISEDV